MSVTLHCQDLNSNGTECVGYTGPRLLWGSLSANYTISFFRNYRKYKFIYKVILVIDGWGISCKIALRWKSLNLIDDKITLSRKWLGAARQQAITITCTNVDPDLCRHMSPLGHNELILIPLHVLFRRRRPCWVRWRSQAKPSRICRNKTSASYNSSKRRTMPTSNLCQR